MQSKEAERHTLNGEAKTRFWTAKPRVQAFLGYNEGVSTKEAT